MAADDPWARRRSLPLAELSGRVLAIDRRTGTTTADLWPASSRPAVEDTGDIDDWLTAIATGRCVGVTPESTVTQYPRKGIVYRPLRDAPAVPVRLAWWRADPHPAVMAAGGLLPRLYRGA
jgi:DNA-binding transcriptional LysR family regulator